MKIQVAVDIPDLIRAVEIVRLLCETGLEIIEAGTPLIKTYGLASVSAFKASCPAVEVVADIKAADVGALEARLARQFGADWATVLGATNIETIAEFVDEARKIGLKSAVDLIGVPNPVDRAREIARAVRPDLFVFHLGIDVQKRSGLRFEQLLEYAYTLKREGYGVAVAGGIGEKEVEYIVKSGKAVDIIIIGRAIVNDISPKSKFIIINNILKHAVRGDV